MNISHFGALSDRIKQIKHTEEGVNAMSDAVRNFAKKYAADINADLTLQLKETEEKMKKEKQILESEKQVLWQSINSLNNREKNIILMRFGLNGYAEKTQKEVADEIGISQSYISRLEKRIFKKLKKEIERTV